MALGALGCSLWEALAGLGGCWERSWEVTGSLWKVFGVLGRSWEVLGALGKVLKDSRIVPFGATSVGKRKKRQKQYKYKS